MPHLSRKGQEELAHQFEEVADFLSGFSKNVSYTESLTITEAKRLQKTLIETVSKLSKSPLVTKEY